MSETASSHNRNIRSTGWLNEWFFAEQPPYGMAMMRIVLPLVLLIDTCFRHPWAREFYSTDGAASPLDVNFQQPGMVFIPGGTLAVARHAILIASLVASSMGWFTRISLGVATVLYTWFGLLDALSTLTKYTVIASHLLLKQLLCFGRVNKASSKILRENLYKLLLCSRDVMQDPGELRKVGMHKLVCKYLYLTAYIYCEYLYLFSLYRMITPYSQIAFITLK